MGLLSSIFKRAQQRSLFPDSSNQTAVPLYFNSENNPTVAACVNKISKTLAQLPLQLYEYTKNGMRLATGHSLYMSLINPAVEETPYLFYSMLYRLLYYRGNVFLFKNWSGSRIVGFQLIHPDRVRVDRLNNVTKTYTIDGKTYTDREILHIPYPGVGYNGTVGTSPINVYRELIDLDNRLLAYTGNYFDNSVGSRVLINLGSSYPLRRNDMDKLYAEIVPVVNKFIQGPGNAGKPMIGLPDSTISKVDQTSNVQADLKSLISYVEHSIAQTVFGIPYEVLDSAASKYDSLESKQNDFLESCIKPLGDHIRQSFESCLPAGDRSRYVIRYEYKNLLTTNTLQTVDALAKEFQTGMLTMNEVRKKLGMDDIGSAGDVHFVPANLMPLTEENINAYMATNKVAMGKQNN